MTDSPDGADVAYRHTANPSFQKRVARLRPVLGFLAAFVAVYLLAVGTGIGQSAENALIVGPADQARIFRWRQSVPPLTRGTAVLAAGVVPIFAVALIRRCWREGVAAVAIVVVTFGATQALVGTNTSARHGFRPITVGMSASANRSDVEGTDRRPEVTSAEICPASPAGQRRGRTRT